jgi:hypothetical protein
VSRDTETRNHVRLRGVRFRVSGFSFGCRNSDFLHEETEITRDEFKTPSSLLPPVKKWREL